MTKKKPDSLDRSKKAVDTGRSAASLWERLFTVVQDTEIYADLQTSEEFREEQAAFLRARGILEESERLVVFYNSAAVSPFSDDKTNTCIFMTENRLVSVEGGELHRTHLFEEIERVTVEHTWKLAQEKLQVHLRSGHTTIIEVPSERSANSLRRLIEKVVNEVHET